MKTTALETARLRSPIRVQLIDTHRKAPPRGPITVRLQRRSRTGWAEFSWPSHVTNAGLLGLSGLGRGSRDGQPITIRLDVNAPNMVADQPPIELTFPTWTHNDKAPATITTTLLFHPGPTYPFAAGVPVINGAVVDSAGQPVPGARVWVTEPGRGAPNVEDVRTGPTGAFRLPARWSDGATTIRARAGALTASTNIALPNDLSQTVRLVLS